ncbi:sucrose-6-phosphate hydrolase [Lactobacillus corticis]|uniref:Sucrose-6-phosphate hydrolase n=1 Tax=Lactobacillus corticis TaxID=2201249 RepID=A0A916QI08_9LACO|nr:sucrose-6-phosphate hydrolase [Lactobacillus corticis]GFZ27309.1 sucrose-6-phosphate hydrolase [Lactobacillus corticis]
MEWTRAKRYLPYDQWSAERLLKLQAQADRSQYQLRYHIRPKSGLLNDPNGFSYFNGAYHVFYQSFPFGAVHGLKSWMHMTSPDMVNWQEQGLAIAPDTTYDSHGAYSGSAIQQGDKLFLMYTGNHRTEDWERIPYQLGAWMDKTGKVTKLPQPLFKNPAGISEHFRDPQVIKANGKFYAVLGAQTASDQTGQVMLYQSKDLLNWEKAGFLHFTDEKLGYMVECPNLVKVDGKYVLIFCPQGLSQEVSDYQNIYPNMYVIFDDINWDTLEAVNPSPLYNLDGGFDVYATQAFNDQDGTAYAISWVGLPDISYPTDDENWANCLSQVKELHLKDGRLYQTPVSGIASLHEFEQSLENTPEICAVTDNQYELELTIAPNQQGNLYLQTDKDLKHGVKLTFDTAAGYLALDRSQTSQPFNEKYGLIRSSRLPAQQAAKLRIFVDHSLIEVFVNDGEQVLTGRYFTSPAASRIAFDQPVNYRGHYWDMRPI